MSHKVSLVLACTIEGGVGYKNQLPWHILKEMKKFKSITTSVEKKGMINAVIMGRDTWESLKKTPLSNRINIILTKNKYHNLNPDNYNNVIIAHSIIDAIIHCSFNDNINNIFIIGGAQIYNIFLRSEYYFKMIDKIYLSIIFYDKKIKTDTFIDMDSIFINFNIQKDMEYKNESDNRLFASYICYPKDKFKFINSLYNNL